MGRKPKGEKPIRIRNKVIEQEENRNTTIWSLTAFVLMLQAKDKKEFAEFYSIATHEQSGKECWRLMGKEGQFPQNTKGGGQNDRIRKESELL